VRNPHPDEGQLSSLLAALQLADRPGVEGLLTTLVDVPLVTPDTVRTLLARHRATRAPVVRPAKDARHGHPVIFDRAVFEDLRRADRSIGAKAVLAAHASRVDNVPVDDEGAFTDIDTPEAYEKAIGPRLTGG
jgi:molybdenum cofactor cytidylyltransferase